MKKLLLAVLFALLPLAVLPPVSAQQLPRASSHGSATATAGAATLNSVSGTITSEALTTAAGAAYTLTLANSKISAVSSVLVTVDNGTNTTAGLEVGRVTPAAASATILIWNRHASAALNGTIKIRFVAVQ